MRETVNDIIRIRLHLRQLLAHRGSVCTVFRRPRQTDSTGCGMLLGLKIIELQPIVKRPPGIGHEVVFDDLLLFRTTLAITAATRQ